jgi:hypothetical protein
VHLRVLELSVSGSIPAVPPEARSWLALDSARPQCAANDLMEQDLPALDSGGELHAEHDSHPLRAVPALADPTVRLGSFSQASTSQ